MAPPYKLTYFDVPAVAEPARFLLSYGKIDFEDKRIKLSDWPAAKSTLNLPLGQMPTLEHNGRVMHQSMAINRYLAKKVDLVGNNDWENLEIDAAADTVNDFRAKISTYYYENDPDRKEKIKGPLYNETVPFYLQKLDEDIQKNNGYLALGRLTWADLFLASLVEYFNYMLGKDVTENKPAIKKLYQAVMAIPSIKSYLERRPKPT